MRQPPVDGHVDTVIVAWAEVDGGEVPVLELRRQGRIALGAELRPIPVLSFFLGYGFPNDSYSWRTSFGIGLNFKELEFGFGIQSIEHFYPGYSTKGLAFGTYVNIRT